MRDAFVRTLADLAAQDPAVMLVNGDLGFKVLDDYIARFPGQYVNAGVAEQTMTALACGMALAGARAYTYSIGNFPTLRCLEHLRNDVCYHGADVTVVAVGGGFSYGQLGMSHFATEDLAILRALPGMTMVAPSDPWADLRIIGLTGQALVARNAALHEVARMVADWGGDAALVRACLRETALTQAPPPRCAV